MWTLFLVLLLAIAILLSIVDFRGECECYFQPRVSYHPLNMWEYANRSGTAQSHYAAMPVATRLL